MAKDTVPAIGDIEQAQREASTLDIRLTNAGFYLGRSKMKTRLNKLTDQTRSIRRELDDMYKELTTNGD